MKHEINVIFQNSLRHETVASLDLARLERKVDRMLHAVALLGIDEAKLKKISELLDKSTDALDAEVKAKTPKP